MRFRIRHTTAYRYDRPVSLGRHTFRMHPRPDPFLRADDFRISIHPTPLGTVSWTDIEGNLVLSATFEGATQETLVTVESVGETLHRPPTLQLAREIFGGAEASVSEGPIEIGGTVLLRPSPAPVSASVAELVRCVLRESGPGSLDFLTGLSRQIHSSVRNNPRLFGPPHPPEVTLQERCGSCRDIAVLFIAACRSLGFEARFVSGYTPASPGEIQHMHAWAEVRLPEVGWLPFDPTLEGDVGERHIPVAAAVDPADAAPITGYFSARDGGIARSEMTVILTVEAMQ